MAVPIIDVNAVGIHVESDQKFVVTVGGSNSKTTKWRLDHTHFLLMIIEYAKARGISLPSVDDPHEDGPEAKPWTPWVVAKEKPLA